MKKKAKFLDGGILGHIFVMTLSASLGLLALFVVDFLDLYFIAQLGEDSLTAAIGFASTVLFFIVSISIGMLIASSALTAQKLGAHEDEEAKSLGSNTLYLSFITSAVMAGIVWIFARDILLFLGAEDETLHHSISFMRIVLCSTPILSVALVGNGILRGHGDAKRSMMVTLMGGITNAVLDPIFIFGMDWGLKGAAYATVCAHIVMAITAIAPLFKHYEGVAPFNKEQFKRDFMVIFAIAAPVILTNIATPVGNFMVTKFLAPYGDSVMAGYSVVGRLMPLALCLIFALSGAIGPIVGQNFGAKAYDRIRQTLLKSNVFIVSYLVIVWGICWLAQDFLIGQFKLSDGGADLLSTFIIFVIPLSYFNGLLFVSNSAFNNLKRPLWASFLNWGRQTVGILPFIYIGSLYFGADGILIGQVLGAVAFSVFGILLSFHLVKGYESGTIDPKDSLKRKIFDKPA